MPSELETFEKATETLCQTLLNRANQVRESTDGWQAGVEARYYHDLRTNEHGQLSVGVTPAQPFPINILAEADADRHVVDTTNLRFWMYAWGRASAQPAPTPADPAGPSSPGVTVVPGSQHGQR